MTKPNSHKLFGEASQYADLESRIEKVIDDLSTQKLSERIWQKDSTVWKKDDPVAQKSVKSRLGWLDTPKSFQEKIAELNTFSVEVRAAGITHVVLLGMGGSSLCVEVIRETFGIKEGHPALHVIDSTHPDYILAIEAKIDLANTLFIVASKSGTTLEPECYFNYFWDKVNELPKYKSANGQKPGSQFCAITDPDTVLAELGTKQHFRQVFINPPDIGGRFSVISYFGLVAAALIGVDLEKFLARAESEAELTRHSDQKNAGLTLGAAMGVAATDGRNKITIETSKEFRSFGYWAEQLLAESTGKEGKGIVPVEGEPPAKKYGDDRLFIELRSEKLASENAKGLEPKITFVLRDPYDLAAQFFRWEFATAIAGYVLGINPFDEPNVAESKANTNKVLSTYSGHTTLVFPDQCKTIGSITISGNCKGDSLHAVLDNFFQSNVKPGSYIAAMAYIARNDEHQALLDKLRAKLLNAYGCAVTVGYGPRFLHSTGQLHKGGPKTGVFLQITDKAKHDMQIPDKPFSFETLIHAQAIGDYESLTSKGLPVISLYLDSDDANNLEMIEAAIN